VLEAHRDWVAYSFMASTLTELALVAQGALSEDNIAPMNDRLKPLSMAALLNPVGATPIQKSGQECSSPNIGTLATKQTELSNYRTCTPSSEADYPPQQRKMHRKMSAYAELSESIMVRQQYHQKPFTGRNSDIHYYKRDFVPPPSIYYVKESYPTYNHNNNIPNTNPYHQFDHFGSDEQNDHVFVSNEENRNAYHNHEKQPTNERIPKMPASAFKKTVDGSGVVMFTCTVQGCNASRLN
jgi:hypothetical protein